MGIKGLWDKLQDCEEVASDHFERTKRPLRIAVDEAIWRYACYLPPEKVAFIRQMQPAANPNEKNIFIKVLQLLKLNIQLIFVADGSKRPAEKYDHGRKIPPHRAIRSQDHELLRQTLALLGIRWHEAPGEAEAECARMQQLGIVDAVWSEDGDALMFGCTLLIRFFRMKVDTTKTSGAKGAKDATKIRVYRAETIQKKYPNLNRSGLVLFTVLSGGDYDGGLRNCGPEGAIAAVGEGLGEEICETSPQNLMIWKGKLQKFFQEKHPSKLLVPDNFPKPSIVQLYKQPLVSSDVELHKLTHSWDIPFDEWELQKFILQRYNYWLDEYIEYVLPILLTRSLALTEPGQEASNKGYGITYKESKLECSITYLPFAVTSLDKTSWVESFRQPSEQRKKKYRDVQLDGKVQAAGLLTCIIKHGIEKASRAQMTPSQPPKRAADSPAQSPTASRPPKRLRTSTVQKSSPPKRLAQPKSNTFIDLVSSSESDDDDVTYVKSQPLKGA